MRRVVKLCVIVGMVVACMTGCQSYQEMLDNHEALKMQSDGIWVERYMERWEDEPGEQAKRTVKLSANVLKDMTEEQMLDVLEYYELFFNALLEGDVYTKERDVDFICYATFYRGETDEVIRKFKYVNHKSVTITAEDEDQFVSPIFHSRIPGGM